MNFTVRAFAFAISVVTAMSAGEQATGQSVALPNPNVPFEYRNAVASKAEPDLKKLEDAQAWLEQRQFLQRFAQFISPLKFDKPLLLKTQTCDVVNAYYDYKSTITFCYEILPFFQSAAVKYGKPLANSPGDITTEDILIGGMGFTMLHELGHAVFDLFNVPLFGRNEDGADQVAAYVALQLSPELALKMVKGGAVFLRRAQEDPKAFVDYVDNHGSSSQRFANIFCMAYGFDKSAYAFVADQGLVPPERLANCAAEYKQVENAFAKTLLPRLDKTKMAEVRAKTNWFSRDFK